MYAYMKDLKHILESGVMGLNEAIDSIPDKIEAMLDWRSMIGQLSLDQIARAVEQVLASKLWIMIFLLYKDCWLLEVVLVVLQGMEQRVAKPGQVSAQEWLLFFSLYSHMISSSP